MYKIEKIHPQKRFEMPPESLPEMPIAGIF
jgi:hypothetical protein